METQTIEILAHELLPGDEILVQLGEWWWAPAVRHVAILPSGMTRYETINGGRKEIPSYTRLTVQRTTR